MIIVLHHNDSKNWCCCVMKFVSDVAFLSRYYHQHHVSPSVWVQSPKSLFADGVDEVAVDAGWCAAVGAGSCFEKTTTSSVKTSEY